MAISREELLRRVNSDSELRSGIEEFLPLSFFLRDCILKPGFSYPDDLGKFVSLTPEGEEARKLLSEIDSSLSEGNVHAILFAVFAHNDLFIDFPNSSSEGIMGVISKEVRESRIRYPYTYHRELIDRYFSLFGASLIRSLDAKQTQSLLEGSPQGVFQIGQYCSGPFGLIKSEYSRFIPIQIEAEIAQCEKLSCRIMHKVQWRTSETAAGDAFGNLVQRLRNVWGTSPPWTAVFADFLFPDSSFYSAISSDGLLQLLSNSLSDGELKELFRGCLNDPSTGFRLTVNSVIVGASKKSGDLILDDLNRAQMLQLFLQMSDEDLCRKLDDVIMSGLITIHPTEVRFPRFNSRVKGSFIKTAPQISHLGVRFAHSENAVLLLMNYLKLAVDPLTLDWELMSVEGNSLDEKLEKCINETEVRDVLERFALRSKESFESITNYLKYGSFSSPKTLGERQALVDKLLWKFGFEVTQSNDSSGILRHRLNELDLVLKKSTENIDELRSTAVNLFVSLETFLDESISFVSFSLINDHFIGAKNGRFGYSISSGREIVHKFLNGGTRSSGSEIKLSDNGHNNLFGLIHSFRELGLFVQECLGNEVFEKQMRRPLNEFPRWARNNSPLFFPFEHSVFFYDLDPIKLHEVLDVLSRVTQTLIGAKVDAVRNRVPHGNREFPSRDELSLVHTACDEVLFLLEKYGCSANVFALGESFIDQHGRVTRWYVDQFGSRVRLRPNSELRATGMPLQPNLLMFHGVNIKGTAECPRFIARFESPFDAMWRNIPRGIEREIDKSDFRSIEPEVLN